MSKAEAFEAKFAGNRSINVEVNFSKGDAIKVPVNINSMDADKLAQNIAEKLDLSSVASKVEEESQAIQGKIDNIDLSSVARQGENIHATNTAIYESLKSSSGYIKMTNSEYDEFKAHIIEVTNDILN